VTDAEVAPLGFVSWKEILGGSACRDDKAADMRGEVGVLAIVLGL